MSRRHGAYLRGDAWHEAHKGRHEYKTLEPCTRCAREVRKSRSVRLLYGEGSQGTPKKIGYLCQECWARFWEEYIV